MVCLFALLFAQLAMAAHACPTVLQLAGKVRAMSQQQMTPCADMDRTNRNLCHEHCQQGFQSVDTLAPLVLDAPVLPLLLRVVTPPAHFPAGATVQDGLLAHAASPPSCILNCVLRV
jgi:hypothetical protein